MNWSVWSKKRKIDPDFIEKNDDKLLAFLTGKTGDRIVAEDMVQDVWIKFFNAKGEEIKNPRAYLFRVATNHVNDFYRTKKPMTDLESVHNSTDYSSNKTDWIIKEQEQNDKLRHVLSEEELKLFRLTNEGYSSKEIGEQLGMNEKTVSNKRSLIKKKLQKSWGDE